MVVCLPNHQTILVPSCIHLKVPSAYIIDFSLFQSEHGLPQLLRNATKNNLTEIILGFTALRESSN